MFFVCKVIKSKMRTDICTAIVHKHIKNTFILYDQNVQNLRVRFLLDEGPNFKLKK
jgi:hypothetical protein